MVSKFYAGLSNLISGLMPWPSYQRESDPAEQTCAGEDASEPGSPAPQVCQPASHSAGVDGVAHGAHDTDEPVQLKRSRDDDRGRPAYQPPSKRAALSDAHRQSIATQPSRNPKQRAARLWSCSLVPLDSTTATPAIELDLSGGERLASLPRLPWPEPLPQQTPAQHAGAARPPGKEAALDDCVEIPTPGRTGAHMRALPSQPKQAAPAAPDLGSPTTGAFLDLCPDEHDEYEDAPEADVLLTGDDCRARGTPRVNGAQRSQSPAEAHPPEPILPPDWNWDRIRGMEGLYPPTAKGPGVLKLTSADLSSLDPATYANDQVMNLYIKMLEAALGPREGASSSQRVHAETLRKRVVLMHSFFYTKLTEARSPSDQDDTGHENVMRWTRERNVFDARFIFVPIHSGCHWSLAVICNPDDLLEYAVTQAYPALHGESASESLNRILVPAKPVLMDVASTSIGSTERYPLVQILHLDPLPGTHNTSDITTALANWLLRELEVKISLDAGRRNDLQPRIAAVQPTLIPCQPNYHDCGLFVLTYLEQMLLHLPERIAFDAHASESDRLIVIAESPWPEPWKQSYMRANWFKSSDPAMLRARLQFLGVNIMYAHSAHMPGLHAQLEAAGDFMMHYRKLKAEKYSGTLVNDKAVCQ